MVGSAELSEVTQSGSGTPVFAIDEEWRFTYLNDGAEGIFENRAAELRGQRVWPWLEDGVREVYRETFERASKGREPAEAEVRCPRLQRWFRVQAYPLEDGVAVHLSDLSARVERELELERRELALREAHEITADRELGTREKIRRLLGVVRGTLGTEVGLLSRRDHEEGTFRLLCIDADGSVPIREGAKVPPEQTRTCEEVVRTEQTLVMRDVAEQTPDLYEAAAGAESYLGAPVEVDGEPFGTFCFFSTDRRPEEFDDWEITYVELFAERVGLELEQSGGWPADRQA